MFIEDLTQFFLDKLNANSKGVIFKAGYLFKRTDTEFEYKEYPNYYTVETKKFTPAMFNFIGTPQNVPNRDITEWTVLTELILTGENENDPELIKEQDALEEFRLNIINNPTDTLNNYKVIMSANPIARSGDIRIRGSKPRITIGMELTLQTGIGLLSGNDNVYSLGLAGDSLVNVFPIQSASILGGNIQSEPDLTANNSLTQSTAIDSTIRYDMSFIDDGSNIMNELKKLLLGFNKKSNTKFDLQIVFPLFVLNKQVILSGGTISMNANNVQVINCQFNEST